MNKFVTGLLTVSTLISSTAFANPRIYETKDLLGIFTGTSATDTSRSCELAVIPQGSSVSLMLRTQGEEEGMAVLTEVSSAETMDKLIKLAKQGDGKVVTTKGDDYALSTSQSQITINLDSSGRVSSVTGVEKITFLGIEKTTKTKNCMFMEKTTSF